MDDARLVADRDLLVRLKATDVVPTLETNGRTTMPLPATVTTMRSPRNHTSGHDGEAA